MSEAALKDKDFEYGKSGDVIEFPGPIWPRSGGPEPAYRIQEFNPPNAEDIAARKLAALKIIEDSLGLADFDAQIDQLLADIRRQAEAVRNYRQAVRTAETGLAAAEADLALPINADKLNYPNDAARRSAIERAKCANPAYQGALRALQDAQNALDTAQLDLDDLERRLAAVRGARAYAAERLKLAASL